MLHIKYLQRINTKRHQPQKLRQKPVQTYAVVRGILGFIFTLLIIATAYCYHDWVQVAFLFSLSVILYLILFAGVFVDTVLDMTREHIIDFIIS